MKFIISFLLLFTATFVAAEESAKLINIKVQSLSLSGQKKDKAQMSVHDAIRNLKPKLAKLPYKDCDLVWAQNISLPMKSKQKFTISNGDQLELELLYIEDQRVGMWIDWHDQAGMDLINTRLHFDKSEVMLAGAEESEDSNKAKMLAISIEDK